MAIKKKKISELPMAESLSGLLSIGVDAENKSVKFNVDDLVVNGVNDSPNGLRVSSYGVVLEAVNNSSGAKTNMKLSSVQDITLAADRDGHLTATRNLNLTGNNSVNIGGSNANVDINAARNFRVNNSSGSTIINANELDITTSEYDHISMKKGLTRIYQEDDIDIYASVNLSLFGEMGKTTIGGYETLDLFAGGYTPERATSRITLGDGTISMPSNGIISIGGENTTGFIVLERGYHSMITIGERFMNIDCADGAINLYGSPTRINGRAYYNDVEIATVNDIPNTDNFLVNGENTGDVNIISSRGGYNNLVIGTKVDFATLYKGIWAEIDINALDRITSTVDGSTIDIKWNDISISTVSGNIEVSTDKEYHNYIFSYNGYEVATKNDISHGLQGDWEDIINKPPFRHQVNGQGGWRFDTDEQFDIKVEVEPMNISALGGLNIYSGYDVYIKGDRNNTIVEIDAMAFDVYAPLQISFNTDYLVYNYKEVATVDQIPDTSNFITNGTNSEDIVIDSVVSGNLGMFLLGTNENRTTAWGTIGFRAIDDIVLTTDSDRGFGSNYEIDGSMIRLSYGNPLSIYDATGCGIVIEASLMEYPQSYTPNITLRAAGVITLDSEGGFLLQESHQIHKNYVEIAPMGSIALDAISGTVAIAGNDGIALHVYDEWNMAVHGNPPSAARILINIEGNGMFDKTLYTMTLADFKAWLNS